MDFPKNATEGPLWVVEQPPPGLVNLGNSCYMNSMLQTLASSRRFCDFVDERAQAVHCAMTRVHEAAAIRAQHTRIQRSVALLKQRRHGDAAIEQTADPGERRKASLLTSPAAALAAAAEMAAEAMDAAVGVAEPLVVFIISALCRAALWLQGWEPPPPKLPPAPPKQQQQTAMSPLAVSACAPIIGSAATSFRRSPRRQGPPPPPAPQLHRLAPATLLLKLDVVLQKLQPSYTRVTSGGAARTPSPRRFSRTVPVDPSTLLLALRNHLPGPSMRLGQQQDAAEALAFLCDSLDTELAAWYMLYGRWMPSPLQQTCTATAAAAGGGGAGTDAEATESWSSSVPTTAELATATYLSSQAPECSGGGFLSLCGNEEQLARRGAAPPPSSEVREKLRRSCEKLPDGSSWTAYQRLSSCRGGSSSSGKGAAVLSLDSTEELSSIRTCSEGRERDTGGGGGSSHATQPAGVASTATAAVVGIGRSGCKFPTPNTAVCPSASCYGWLRPSAGARSSQLPPASPLRGLLATTSTCCVCGGWSVSGVEPFWSLQLPLPPPTPPSGGSPTGGALTPASTSSLALFLSRHSRHLAAAAVKAATRTGPDYGSVEGLRRRPLLPSLDPDVEGPLTGSPAASRPKPGRERGQQPPGQDLQQGGGSGPERSAAAAAAVAAPLSCKLGTGPLPGGVLTLRDCLARAVQPELVEQVECSRCSLMAALGQVRAQLRVRSKEAAAMSAGSPGPLLLSRGPRRGPDSGLGAEGSDLEPHVGEGSSCSSLSNRHGHLGRCIGDAHGGGDCNGNRDTATGIADASPDAGSCIFTTSSTDITLTNTNTWIPRSRGSDTIIDDESVMGRPLATIPKEPEDTVWLGVSAAVLSSSGSSAQATVPKAEGAMQRATERPSAGLEQRVVRAVSGLRSEGPAASVDEKTWRRQELEQQLKRLEDMLSGPHLPDVDLDAELAQLVELLAKQEQRQRPPWTSCDVSGERTTAEPSPSPSPSAPSLTPVRTQALRRIRVVRCPPVLVLQLLRTVWDPRGGDTVKDGRHVAFPMELGPQELALLGVTAMPQRRSLAETAKRQDVESSSDRSDESQSNLNENNGGEERATKTRQGRHGAAPLTPPPRPYILMAVVVHYGGPDSGHYLMYRRIVTVRRCKMHFNCSASISTNTTTATTTAGSSGEQYDGSSSTWLRVSDSCVSLADESEVLQQSAAVLLYELQ